jgi:lipoyl-dependent peroxiredoxin
MSISRASGQWNGTLKAGTGAMKPDHGPEIPFSLATRFEGQKGSNPEEMVGAALCGCFSMALSGALERNGITPERIDSSAEVHLEKDGAGFSVPRITLRTSVKASGGDGAKIQSIATETKSQCPIGKLLKAEITLEVTIA